LQNISKHVQIPNHPCADSPGKFWLGTHTFTHTLLHAHPTHCLDYKVISYSLPVHTPMRKVPGLTRTDPGCGSPFAAPLSVYLLPTWFSKVKAVCETLHTHFHGLS